MLQQGSRVMGARSSRLGRALIIGQIALFGTARQPDEGAAAHLWQLLMAGQLPITAFFVLTSVPRSPRSALPVLVLQLAAALAAVGPVFILGW